MLKYEKFQYVNFFYCEFLRLEVLLLSHFSTMDVVQYNFRCLIAHALKLVKFFRYVNPIKNVLQTLSCVCISRIENYRKLHTTQVNSNKIKEYEGRKLIG